MAMYYGDWPQEEESNNQSPFDELRSMMRTALNNQQKMAMYYGYWPQEEASIDQSTCDELMSMMLTAFNTQQKFANDMNDKLDFISKDLNGKLDVVSSHLVNIEAHIAQTAEVLNNHEEANEPKEVYSTWMPIADYFALIDSCENIDTQKYERLSANNNEVTIDIDYLDTLIDHDDKLSVNEESSLLLEKINLGDEIEVDTILNEINTPKVENDYRKKDIVFNKVERDEVDNYFMDSFEHEVDFVFPSNAFDPHVHSYIKEEVKFYATFVENYLDFSFSILSWKTVCFLVHFVSYLDRRRIKGALAQPFDTND